MPVGDPRVHHKSLGASPKVTVVEAAHVVKNIA